MNVFEKTTCKVHYIGTNSAKLAYLVDGLVGMYIKTLFKDLSIPMHYHICIYIYIYEVTCT